MIDFDKKCQILAELWTNDEINDYLYEFIQVHDLGFPLAYLYTRGHIVDVTGSGKELVEQTFTALEEMYKADGKDISILESIIEG